MELTPEQLSLIESCLPKQRGTVHTRMRRRSKAGVLDKMFVGLQHEQLVHLQVDMMSLDSTSIKARPNGTGALKNTDLKPSTNPEVDGIPKSICSPQTPEQL